MNARRIDRWYPLLRPTDGTFISAPDLRLWIVWCRAAVDRLEDSRALSAWDAAMAPHFATIRAIEPEAVNLIGTLIAERLNPTHHPILGPAEDSEVATP